MFEIRAAKRKIPVFEAGDLIYKFHIKFSCIFIFIPPKKSDLNKRQIVCTYRRKITTQKKEMQNQDVFYLTLSIKISNCQVKFFHSIQITHVINRDYSVVLLERDNSKEISKSTTNNCNILHIFVIYTGTTYLNEEQKILDLTRLPLKLDSGQNFMAVRTE